MPKKIPDVSEALRRLFSFDIEPKLDEETFRRPNPFRRDHCYVEDVTAVLWAYGGSLRNIFNGIASTLSKSSTLERNLLSLDEWRVFMRGLGLINVDVSERDVNLAFSWSRMCVGDSKTPAGSKKDSALPFEGFLEAICRMAMMKALPTDDEITAAECEDAATYLAQLELVDTTGYEQLLLRKTPWGADQKRQPPHRCVAHLIALMLRAVKVSKAEDDGTEVELFVSQAEAGRWQKRKFAASSGRMC